MKEKSPGEDEVRMIYIKEATIKIKRRIIEIIQTMFEEPAEKWDNIVKTGIVIPLYKKGDKTDPGNYRGVCLSMASRILARVMTTRLRDWSEKHKALDDNQDGFRQGRSTADTTQIAIRLNEDNRRVTKKDKTKASLQDLAKAYPRVDRPLLWKILETYGFEGNFLERLKDLHETTEYKVRTGKEISTKWIPQRGLREGCPSSPILFNVFHQVVMRVAENKRTDGGVQISYVPRNACMEQRRDLTNEEAEEITVKNILFANDTTISSQPETMNEAKKIPSK